MAADDIQNVLREEPPAYGAAAKPSPILVYLRKVEAAHEQGNDTEHTHRPALKALLEALDSRIVATNEPKRIECGAPDLVITRKKDKLLQGHVEAKDIGVSLNEAKKSEQLKRYLPALSNLLLTDYLDFRWFVNGAEKDRFCLAEIKRNGEFVHDTSAFARAEKVLKEFLSRDPVRIESAEDLARRLAQLAHLIRDSIALAFQTGNASEVLKDWRAVFAQTLLPELADEGKEAEFADMFAQTLAYGLFSARVMSASSRQFTLAEAANEVKEVAEKGIGFRNQFTSAPSARWPRRARSWRKLIRSFPTTAAGRWNDHHFNSCKRRATSSALARLLKALMRK